MRKFTIVISLLVVFSVLLAACSPSKELNETPEGTEVGVGMTSTAGIPVTGDETQTVAPPASTSAVETTPEATQEVTQASTQAAPSTSLDPGLLSNEMKFPVVDAQNQPLGAVQDFVLDFVNRKVAYVVASITPTNTSQAKVVAVPWNMLKLQPASSVVSSSSSSATNTPAAPSPAGDTQYMFVYSGGADLLANAPAFVADSLPKFGLAAGNWDADLISYWSGSGAATATPSAAATLTDTPAPTATPAVQPALPPALVGVALASKVIGFGVMDSSNPQFAKITDVVIDIDTGAIKYVIVNVNDKLFTVPLEFIGFDAQNTALVLAGGAQILQNAPNFDVASFPLTTKIDWDAQIHTFWQNLMMQPAATPTP